jgi:N-acetyl-alpha-D-muramate 1-phosphate uridylyltransferase
MRRIEHAVIMAAGRGQRMAPLTDAMPKPMAPYQGTTLIAEGIKRLHERVPYVHITVGYKKAMLAQHVIENGVSSVLNTEGQSNSWWIYHTLLSRMDEPIYVLTCDNIVALDFELLEHSYRELDEPPCMLVPVRPVAGLDGDYVFRDGDVVTRLDRHEASDIYCSGVQILNPSAVRAAAPQEGDFYTVWHQLIAARRLRVSAIYPKQWIAIDTFEQLARLNAAH